MANFVAPLQGYIANSLSSQALDNVSLVLDSSGQASINLNNINYWNSRQEFDNGIGNGTNTLTSADTGWLKAGPGILANSNTWAGTQVFLLETTYSNATGADNSFEIWNYNGSVANASLYNLGGLQFQYNSLTTDTGSLVMRGSTDSSGVLTDFQLWFYSYVLNNSAMTIDYFTGDVNVFGNVTTLSAAGAASQGIIRAPNWNGTNWGLQIGANASGVAAIMVNAPSGFANWLEQLMVNSATMWHVDASGNAVAAGNVTGATLAGAIINSNQTLASFAGTTAGTVYWSMPFQGTAYKKVIIYFDGYENDTTTAQTITYPVAFAYTPNIYNPNSVAGLSATITELAINPDSASTYTGFVVLDGF